MQRIETRTIHTITIDLQDDILAGLQFGDEVEVVLTHRGGITSRKRLTYRDLTTLLPEVNDPFASNRKVARA
jgi:hypothetical protein